MYAVFQNILVILWRPDSVVCVAIHWAGQSGVLIPAGKIDFLFSKFCSPKLFRLAP